MIDLSPGRTLGDRFVLIRRLAEAGSTQVWLAEDRELEQRVALKCVDAERLTAAGVEARLQAEMERAQSLPAELAVNVLGLYRADGLALLAMEYLPGGDLGQFRGRPYGVYARALDQVARALEAAHAQGLVHRDLKCANVLLDADGRARLADFGLATLAGRVARGGSPYNASPQQLRGEPAAPADDLYAFGALLYELLCGHPPWYPDVTPDRVLHEPVPPLVPRHPAPERLRQLALRLLAKSPAQRPASATDLRAELTAALAEAPEEAALSSPGAPAVRVGAAAAAPPGRPWLIPAAFALLLAAAAVVFLWLPERLADRAAAVGEDATAAAAAQVEELRQAQADAATVEQARAAAEAARQRFEARLAELEPRGLARWAVEELAAVRRQQAEAARQFESRGYAAAAASWEAALGALESIATGQPEALAAALERGRDALAAGRAAAATEAFALALLIEPDHATAKRGLARAQGLDAALALLDGATRDEQAGRLAAAEAGYREVLARDAELTAAREGLARLAARQQGDAYAAAMSRGLAALAAGRTEEARGALEQARRLRPDSVEAREALAQLDLGQRAATLAALEQRARTAEGAERWAEAVQAWSEALALESGLVAAREGQQRAQQRAALDAQATDLLATPERLWAPAGRAEARRVIEAAAAAAEPKQLLLRQAAELQAAVAAAEIPVRITLQSDGLTDVVINRVGRIGAFERHEVDLLPGRYALVGTRRGFRDVRREIVVVPGGLEAPVTIRCEEAI
jgi:eukaryotic-like serine/threonine-protein kinase